MMRANVRIQEKLLGLVLVTLGLAGSGCPAMKKLFLKPPAEGVLESSSTLHLVGYEQAVTVKAAPEQLGDFISDPDSFHLPGIELGEGKRLFAGGTGPYELGSGFPVTLKMKGIEIKGRVIIIHSDAENTWTVVDNDYIFNVQRWQYQPVKGGTVFRLKMEYEVPSSAETLGLDKLLGISDLMGNALKQIDLALAQVQAHFNPALDPEQLTALGLRGESYETMLQTYQTSVWIDSSPERILAWLMQEDHFNKVMLVLHIEDEHLRRFQEAAVGSIIYAPAQFEYGMIKRPADVFAIKGETALRIYTAVFDRIAMLQTTLDPEWGGTRLTSRLAVELPVTGNPELMDNMFVIAGIPQVMREGVLILKEEVEGGGPEARRPELPRESPEGGRLLP
jgi:hypothetical protein